VAGVDSYNEGEPSAKLPIGFTRAEVGPRPPGRCKKFMFSIDLV